MVTKPYRFLVLSGLFLLISCTPPSTAKPFILSHEARVDRVARLIEHEGKMLKTISPRDLSEHVVGLGQSYDIDPLLILALIRIESNYNSSARSPMGALGLMQIMPCTLRAVGPEIRMTQVRELLDPLKNVHLGVHYLSFLKVRYQHNLQYALAAYNVGPGRVDQLMGKHTVAQGFYQKVLAVYERYQSYNDDRLASVPLSKITAKTHLAKL